MAINNTKERNLKEKAEEVARKVVWGSNIYALLGEGGGRGVAEYMYMHSALEVWEA